MIATTLGSALAFALGVRHGLDADHLAAIDGITRWNAGERRTLAPHCGALFSAGHAGVILAAAMGLILLTRQWEPSPWLGPVSLLLSAITLLVLSAVNLRSAFSPGSTRLIGLRASAFATLLRAPKAWQVLLLGGLFALSLDAIALAALFVASASPSGNAIGVAQLALAFGAGMIVVDTASGRWIAHLVNLSEDSSQRASRVMTITIAGVSFLVSACLLLSLAVEPFEQWLDTHQLMVSGAVISIVLAGYMGASMLTKDAASFAKAADRALFAGHRAPE